VVAYDPYLDEIMADPYRIYRELRDESPVHYMAEYDCWFLSRFATVWEAANDSTHLHTMKGTTPGHLLTRDTPPSMSFNAYDPPAHTPMRAQIKKLFVPAAVRGMRPQIEAYTRELLDELVERGEGDLVDEFAARIAVTGACIAGGIPLSIREQAVEWVNGVMHRVPGHKGATEVGARCGKEMFFYCLELTKDMRKRPEQATGALLTMLTEPVDGKLLDDLVVASTLSLVMIGGSDTFPKALGATIHRLGQHPRQRAEVVANPALAREAFVEALRLDTPTQMLGRTCVAPTEIEGHRIEPGQGVMFMWASANRDEREFERPDDYDIHRRPPRMLAFGQGAHMCVGHHIAKMEPEYEVDEARAERNRTEFVQGFVHLPTRLA